MRHMTLRASTIVAGATLIAGLSLTACSRDTTTVADGSTEAISVTVARVAVADVAQTFEAGGLIQAQTTATLTARILAPVREVRARPGDRVRTGQVLIVLDGRDLAAQARRARAASVSADQDVLAADAERQAAQAAFALARSTHARIAGLHAKRSATSQELDDATAALRATEARAVGAAARAQAAVSSVEAVRRERSG